MTILQIAIRSIDPDITPEFYFNEILRECQTSYFNYVLKTELLHHYNREPICNNDGNWVWELNLELSDTIINELTIFMMNKLKGYYYNNLISYGNIKYINEDKHYEKYINPMINSIDV